MKVSAVKMNTMKETNLQKSAKINSNYLFNTYKIKPSNKTNFNFDEPLIDETQS
jgi:hypothetical protein